MLRKDREMEIQTCQPPKVRHGNLKYNFRDMRPGNWFFVAFNEAPPHEQQSNIHAAAKYQLGQSGLISTRKAEHNGASGYVVTRLKGNADG